MLCYAYGQQILFILGHWKARSGLLVLFELFC